MEYTAFSAYRGLQKPLEFMGFRGRYVYVGIGTIACAILTCVAGSIFAGFLVSFILALLILLSGGIWIFRNQKKGLHSKPSQSGYYMVTHLIHLK